MNVRASLRHLHMSPRKVRLVADLVRGMSADRAEQQLQFHPKWASRPLLKLLQSAIANATNNFHLDRKHLTITKITVDQGPTLKRFRPRAFGSSAMIRKRTSHINIILTSPDKEKPKKPAAKVEKKPEEKAQQKPELKKDEKKSEPVKSEAKEKPAAKAKHSSK